MTVSPTLLKTLEWRCIGPHRGGRVVAVAGDPSETQTFYFGACAGGVWKTTDGGTYWENISDGFFRTASVGAIAVSESDPNVIYAGMGEACIRLDVSHGDGVYKSTDGGKTWRQVGLEDTRHIGRVRIHPRDPDLVYVAALGHAFGPNQERGVFRSKNGGKSWERILFRSENSGAIDLSLDPNNPRILYAAIWQVRRYPWSLESGGPESGLFKSTDGGDTWTELTSNPGMPTGIKGRIGVALSPARPGRVWATVEAEGGALLRSDDGGATWERTSENRDLRQRPWYYQHIFADPQDAETVWVLNLKAWKSVDGGRNFAEVTTPHGDNHDLWIDPHNPRRMIEGNDGGACVSFNGGESWSSIYNQPTAQFYHVTADTQYPYRVYGTQQDNTAISVPSRSYKGAILWTDCYPVGSSESGHIAVRPDNPNIVYSGAIGSAPGGGGILLRYDHVTGQVRIITVWPELFGGWGAKDTKYRFQWTYPIVISPHDPNALYVAGNRVFRSTDEGTSWEILSPDLTRADVSKLGPSGGPITKDTTGAEFYCTIFAFVESPHQQGLFWAGSDDGLIHVSHDGGRSWENVTPPDLPEWATVATIEVSPHDPATAYVAAFRYKLDDYQPYLYKTNDYGKSWQKITNGIPENEFTRVIRQDPSRRGLLYAGTETCVYVSFDDGESWQPLQLNLPVAPIHDLIIKEDDLVAATHGRSFWILDDLTPLRQLADGIPDSPFDKLKGDSAHLFAPRAAYRTPAPIGSSRQSGPGKNYNVASGAPATFREIKKPSGEVTRAFLDAGQNPPDGVVVTYHLKEKPRGEVTLTFLDAKGQEVKRFSSRQAPSPDPSGVGQSATEEVSPVQKDGAQEPTVSAEAGMNRFVWNLRYADARAVPGDKTTERSLAGPLAAPGTYQVQLAIGDETYTQSFEIRKDPRVAATQDDLDAQLALLLRIRDKLSETHDAINQVRNVRQQVGEWAARTRGHTAEKVVADAARGLREKLTAIEEELIQPRATGALDTINFPTRLNAKLAGLTSVVASADAAPTKQSYQVLDTLSGRIDRELGRLRDVLDKDLGEFINLIHELDIPPIIPRAG
jgi:photosystem II stability/assembly factor-like uncharacterized protein